MKHFFGVLILIICTNLASAQQKFPLSNSIASGNLVFVSGQIGINPETSKLVNSNFEEEAKQVMKNLERELKEHNLTMDDLVSTIVYLKDMKYYDALNKVYGSYFKKRFPTRTCIAVADLPAGASVEISGIAEKNVKSEMSKN